MFGHCGTGEEFCWEPTKPTTHMTTAKPMPTTTPSNVCETDSDCPPSAPCCSDFGHCGNGQEFCEHITTQPAPTTVTTTKSPIT